MVVGHQENGSRRAEYLGASHAGYLHISSPPRSTLIVAQKPEPMMDAAACGRTEEETECRSEM